MRSHIIYSESGFFCPSNSSKITSMGLHVAVIWFILNVVLFCFVVPYSVIVEFLVVSDLLLQSIAPVNILVHCLLVNVYMHFRQVYIYDKFVGHREYIC